MKKILHIFIVFLLGFVFLGAKNQVRAEQCNAPISGVGVTLPEYPTTTSHVITIDLSSYSDDTLDYWFELEEGSNTGNQAASVRFRINQTINNACNSTSCLSVNNRVATWTITSEAAFTQSAIEGDIDTKNILLINPGFDNNCEVGTIDIATSNNPGSGCFMRVYQNNRSTPTGQGQCFLNETQSACFVADQIMIIEVSGLESLSGDPWNGNVGLDVAQNGVWGEWGTSSMPATDGAVTFSFSPGASGGADFTMQVEDREWTNEEFPNCEVSFTTHPACNMDQCEPDTLLEVGAAPTQVAQEAFSLCKQIPEEQRAQRTACEECTGGTGESEGNEGVWTAIGCINREPQAILRKFITVGLGMSGGVALLTFLAAGFIFSTSQGDPKAYGKAKEMMTAAIVGILFVIFSITILQFIGFEILKIPGFGV